ncbi:MAG TPA: DUF484 family protein [Gammaproteobacteria bacterium]|nr:DUF484 family protein [Gammaproteobacteria bacterium]
MTSNLSAHSETSPEPDAEQVARFLAEHPEFFEDREQLVAGLRLSHASGGAVSLIERQVQVLRKKNESLKQRLLELVDVARENDRLSERVHHMTLALLETVDAAALVDTLEDRLRNEFEADTVSLFLPRPTPVLAHQAGVHTLPADEASRALLPTLFTESKPLCGRLRQEQLDLLFPQQGTAIGSAAVIPLGPCARQGLLAIGSQNTVRFNSGMGTLFLRQLGELLVCLLRQKGLA